MTRLVESRKADKPGAMAAAREEASRIAGTRAAESYLRGAMKRYAVVHEDLLKRIDMDAGAAAFDKLRKDKRVLAAIAGEKPVTVGDLCENLRHHFFHGVDKAIESKETNGKKGDALRDMVSKRVLLKAALAEKMDKVAVP